MPSRSQTILITGFGPFPGVPYNVSAAVADAVAAEANRRFTAMRIVSAALPTEWDFAPARAAELIFEMRPALALHFGVSGQARGFVVETIAQNSTGRVDAAGMMPIVPVIDPFGPRHLATQLPAGRIAARLQRRGLPARLSRDAGTYLCNAVFYRSVLTQVELGGGGRSGFVHLPVAIAKPSRAAAASRGRRQSALDFDGAVRGGLEILSACVNRTTNHNC